MRKAGSLGRGRRWLVDIAGVHSFRRDKTTATNPYRPHPAYKLRELTQLCAKDRQDWVPLLEAIPVAL